MATTRFFKRELPKTPIYLPNGDKLVFETDDGVVGYFKTDQDDVANYLFKLQAEHRGGIFQIEADEYERAWGKKKAALTPSKASSQWREELGGGTAPDTMLQRRVPPDASGAAAAAAKPIAPTPPPPASSEEEIPTPKRPMRPPNVGRRI